MATAKSAPKKATTPRRKPVPKTEPVQTPVEEKVQTPPTSCHNGPDRTEGLPPVLKAFIEKMSERAHQESPEGKVEHILHVLKGSSVTEARNILEDVGTALTRKAEDKQRKAERKLYEMRKDHSLY